MSKEKSELLASMERLAPLQIRALKDLEYELDETVKKQEKDRLTRELLRELIKNGEFNWKDADDIDRAKFVDVVKAAVERLIPSGDSPETKTDESESPREEIRRKREQRKKKREEEKKKNDKGAKDGVPDPVEPPKKKEADTGKEVEKIDLDELDTLIQEIKPKIEAAERKAAELRDILSNITDLYHLIKHQQESGDNSAEITETILDTINQLNFQQIRIIMITAGLSAHVKLMGKIIKEFEKYVLESKPKEEKLKKPGVIIEWPEDPRPVERHSWDPWKYITVAMSQVKVPREAVLKDSVLLLGEFNELVENHPEYKKNVEYWKTAMASWNMLMVGDPRSGGSDFTVDFKAWKEGAPQSSKYDVEHVKEVFAHKDFGSVAMRIAALIEIILSDPNFEYPDAVKTGQFLARKMDKNADNLRSAIKHIVQEEKWLEKEKIDPEYQLVDVVFNIVNSLDMRGHFFLDDTAAATTKGFGGEDYTWACRPEATVNYDIDRYNREAKASWYILAAADIPNSWHERVAINLVLTLNPLGVSKKKRESEVIDGPELPSYNTILAGLNPGWSDFTEEKRISIAIKYAKEVVAKELIENEKDKVHDLRHWFHILMSEADRRKCMEYAVTKTEVSDKESPFVRKEYGVYEFRDRGPTFPTVYQFYMAQMSKLDPNQDKIAAASLDRDSVLAEDFDYSTFEFDYSARISGFAQYQVAYGGWLEALDMIKDSPKVINGVQLLKNVDKFFGAIGKAKIVDGAHHNMMNTLAYLYLVKQFKFLEPRNYTEFTKYKNRALDKVLGGGIPNHVKNYIKWIFGEAKSVDSSRLDKPGDMLRPMDPSLSELVEDSVHHATKGLENETGIMTAWTSLWAKVEGVAIGLSAVEGGKAQEIPLGDIEWDNQDVSTKQEK